MKKYSIYTILIALPLPLLAFSLGGATRFKDIIMYLITDIIDPLILILNGLAFLVFFYGLIKFVIKADNETELKKGKQYMKWGILALFILISFRTILGLMSGEFEFGQLIQPILPTNLQATDVNARVIYPE